MSKLGRGVALVGAAVAGYAAWIKLQQNREERDLWAEVTDSFETYPPFEKPGEQPSPTPEGTPSDAEPRG